MPQCVGLTHNNNTENPKYYILWGPHTNGIISGKFKIGFYYTRKTGITAHMNKHNNIESHNHQLLNK
jgi:hypothetical protein